MNLSAVGRTRKEERYGRGRLVIRMRERGGDRLSSSRCGHLVEKGFPLSSSRCLWDPPRRDEAVVQNGANNRVGTGANVDHRMRVRVRASRVRPGLSRA